MEAVDGYSTKSLVENIDYLQKACTPVSVEYTSGVNGLGQTIGVWANYRAEIDGKLEETENVFDGTRLIYNPKGVESDPKARWEYEGTEAYWVIGGEYVFRAYYPQNELNINKRLSNAKTLIIESNTASTQRDMLLAYNKVDTKQAGWTITDPVKLNFRHAMAAMLFKFKFYDGSDGVFYSEDAITSCWMEVDKDEACAITGYMIYGNGTDYEEGNIQWTKQYSPIAGYKFYHWSNTDGIPFKNQVPPAGESWGSKYQQIAVPYSKVGTGAEDVGAEFTKQDGWVMTVPQESTGHLKLCFTTKSGGDAVFTVTIPKKTGTSLENYNDYQDEPDKQRDSNGTDWIPGYRYTYTISISKTNANVSLSIAPWKRRDSSFDIKFN